MLALGQLALERRRFADASHLLGTAESIYASTAEADDLPLARARLAYARALTGAAGEVPAEARTRAKQALDAFRARGRHAEARAAEAWQAEHG